MNILKISLPLAFVALTSTFSNAQVNPDFQPLADSFNVSNPAAVQAINIPYGDIEPNKQLFHIFLPDTQSTFPLVVFFHGGGFTGGNPGTVFQDPERRETVKYFLENGVAFISVGYRLIAEGEPDMDGVIKCLSDSKLGLQFIRYHAESLHIDPEKVALMGSSAGGGTSLWLGTRDDMADPEANDPVLQQSTRVLAMYASGSQATYDLYKWETEIFRDFDGPGTSFTLDSIAKVLTTETLENFYGGLDSLYQLAYDPTLIQYRQDVDMLYHLSSDDPPLYIFSKSMAEHPAEDVLHHWYHSQEMYEAALAADLVEVKAEIRTPSIDNTDGESANEFLLRHLTSSEATPVETVLSVEDIGGIQVYPNPASSYFFINPGIENSINVVILTPSGVVVGSQINVTRNTPVSIASLNAGLYLVKVIGTKTETFRRLFVR